MDANDASTLALAPSPTATIAITAKTPMMMPRVVRKERSLLRRRARTATRMVRKRFMREPPFRRRLARRSLRGQAWPLAGRSRPDQPVLHAHHARRILRDVGLVRHQHDGDPGLTELLEERHDLQARA